MIKRQVDGLIIASSQTNDDNYRTLTNQIPVLQLDRHIGQSTLPMVITDAAKVTAELIGKTAGTVNEFYYFGGQLELSPSRHRMAGFKLGLNRAGLELDEGWIRHRDYQTESGYILMEQLHKELGRLPQALFTASYTLLEGVLRYLNEHNQLNALVNKEMRLVTFDNHDLLDCLPLNIDSIAQNSEELASHSFQLIQRLMSNQTIAPTAYALDATIHWRS